MATPFDRKLVTGSLRPSRPVDLTCSVLLVLAACGGPKLDRPDSANGFFLDGGAPVMPTVPRLDSVPSAVPYPLVTIQGEVEVGRRVLVTGGENPFVVDVLPDGRFCIDVPLREQRVFDLELLAQSDTGALSAPARVTVEFNSAAPDPPSAATCSGADPRGCVRASEICTNSRDDDCDGFVDSRDADCATCDDDLFEDNDATPAPRVPLGRLDELRICPNDGDYYAYELDMGNRLDARILFAQASGDLDMTLLDPMGMSVAMASTQNDDEMLSYTAAMPGLHHLYVFGVTSEVENNYSLDVQIVE